MKPFSFLSRLFGSRRKSEPVILSITPPQFGERTLLGVENLLQSIAFPEPFSLELVGDEGGVRLLARCYDSQSVAAQITAHYPQARIRRLDPKDDPMRFGDDQEAWTMSLRSGGPPQASLQQFSEDVLSDEGSDPMLATIGALSPLRGGERVVTRLLLRSLGPQWSAPYELQLERQSAASYPSPRQESQVNHGEIVRIMLLGVAALVGLKTWQFWQDGDFREGDRARRRGRVRRAYGRHRVGEVHGRQGGAPRLAAGPRQALTHGVRRRTPGHRHRRCARGQTPRGGAPTKNRSGLSALRQSLRRSVRRTQSPARA